MKISHRLMLVLFCVLVFIPGLTAGQERIVEKADLEAFVDGIMRAHMEADNIAGATFLINETAVRAFGWHSPGDAITKRLRTGSARLVGEIVGVVRDFHFQGLQQEIGPLIITKMPQNLYDEFNYITLTISTEEIPKTLAFVNENWKELFPGIPCEYYFLDEDFDRFYRSEEKTFILIGVFTLMGVLIACLGLFGLASFLAGQRTKEIAIRKIHGAQVSNIVSLQIKDFVKWILVSNIIAWPVAYFAMNKWLESFAYRIEAGIWLFLLSGMIALSIALFSVSYLTLKVATSNPVDSLRYE